MKTCIKCGTEKTNAEFYAHKLTADGLRSKCKTCNNAASVEWGKNNPGCAATATAKYRDNNSAKVKAASDLYRSTNMDKIRANGAAWQKANPEKMKLYYAKYNTANPERMAAIHAKYRDGNAEKIKYRKAEWQKANAEKCVISSHNYRARKVGGKLTQGLAERLLVLQCGMCVCGCNQHLGDNYHLDHIMPLSLGGSNVDDNIQLLRAFCNISKSNKHPDDFMRSRGFLL